MTPRCRASSLLRIKSKVLLPRSCAFATPIDHSHRPHTITVLLDLLRWRFQKDEFVFPGMRVCRPTTLPTAVSLAAANIVGSRVFAKCLTTYLDFPCVVRPPQLALNICPPAAIAASRLHLSTTPLSLSPLVDLHHSCCMNRLGAPHCPDACMELVCLFQMWSPGNSFVDLLFDRRNRRLSFQSLRNCFVFGHRSWGRTLCIDHHVLLNHIWFCCRLSPMIIRTAWRGFVLSCFLSCRRRPRLCWRPVLPDPSTR